MKSPIFILCCLVLTIVSTFAFQKKAPVTKAQLIQERVDLRTEKYRKDAWRRCLEDLYDEATSFVDSVLIEEARTNRDTISKPAKPFKPERPEAIEGRDSLPVAPLLQDTTN